MKFRKLFSVVVGAAALISSSSAAQADASTHQVRQLDKLVGSWRGTGKLTTGGKTLPIRANYKCAKGSGGSGLKCSFNMTGLPNFTYQFDDLWGYSSHDGLVHWYTVTNAGETHDHSGRLDANGALLQFAGPSEGKAFHEEVRFTFKGKNRLSIAWTCNVDGKQREAGQLMLAK